MHVLAMEEDIITLAILWPLKKQLLLEVIFTNCSVLFMID